MYHPCVKTNQIAVFFNLQYLSNSFVGFSLFFFCMTLDDNEIYILRLKFWVCVADNTLSSSRFAETFNF